MVGDGPIKLYLARQNGNHFVPLVRIRQNADRIARLARDSPAQSSSAGSTSVSSPTPAILSRTHLKAALILEAVNCRNKEPEFLALSTSELEHRCEAFANEIMARPSSVSASTLPAPAAPVTLPCCEKEDLESDSDADSEDDAPTSSPSSEDDLSDENDVFVPLPRGRQGCSETLAQCPQLRWDTAIAAIATHLRGNLTLPLQPGASGDAAVFTDVAVPVQLPLWHCPFRGCQACAPDVIIKESHEKAWWDHIWMHPAHSSLLRQWITKQELRLPGDDLQEVCFALLIAAMTLKERDFVPLVGHATDRRSLRHLGEVFREESVKTLMCFICGGKHIYHLGFDKFGASCEKGEISYQSLNKQLTAMFHGNKKNPSEFGQTWKYNLSGKRFRTTFGDAVASDPGLAPDCWEWRRNVRRDGIVEDILCNPEDVQPSRFCRHNNHTVCSKCKIPICHDCWELAAADLPIPRAMCNDNYIG